MEKTFVIDEYQYDIVKRTLRSLGDFSHFDELEIYEDEKKIEIYTTSVLYQYTTRTIINKMHWQAKSYWKKIGETQQKEILIIKPKKKNFK